MLELPGYLTTRVFTHAALRSLGVIENLSLLRKRARVKLASMARCWHVVGERVLHELDHDLDVAHNVPSAFERVFRFSSCDENWLLVRAFGIEAELPLDRFRSPSARREILCAR